jgi:predicted aldo/keto reductase-like oxidoreductase
MLAFGGFHLMEVLPSDAENLINKYMDYGGNLIETAISYGDSELKIGKALQGRRDDVFLSTKTHFRSKSEAAQSIDTSLQNLRTDHLDNLFMHGVNTQEEMDMILSEDGAMAAALEAKQAGKLRYIGITSHNPESLFKSLQRYRFDVVMEWMNYYDYFNFPLIYDSIIPYCVENGIGLMAMKPIADGLLHRSANNAFRWTWSLPIASIAAGNNTLEMLESNIRLASEFTPMSDVQKAELYKEAPEYAGYVCRRCGECQKNKLGIDIMQIFGLEGHYDRQMYSGNIPDAAEYALRERLRFWFANQDYAREGFSKLNCSIPVDVNNEDLGVECPYGIDVARKLRLSAWKLTGRNEYIESQT